MDADFLYPVAGFGVGLLVGLTGVGGGSLMTPILMLMFGVSPAVAVGTDLLFAAATKTVGTLVHGYNRAVSWRITGLLAMGSLPAAGLTLAALKRFGVGTPETAAMIRLLLGYMLLATAGLLLARRWLPGLSGAGEAKRPPLSPLRQAVLTVMAGAALGSLVTLSSVGAGALGVTAILLIHPSLPILRVVATDISHAVPLTLVGGVGYWALGSVDAGMLMRLLMGSVPGVLIGAMVSPRLPEGLLRPMLALVLAVVGLKLVGPLT